MAHPRKLIRHAVVARLQADIPTLAAKIFPNRITPLFQSALPCIVVYTLKEPAEVCVESPREYRRDLQVIIEALATADNSLDDTLDDLCEQIENSIFKEETFGGLVTDTLLTESEVVLLGDGEKKIGAAQITLSMPYNTILPGDLTGNLDPLERFNTKFDVDSDGQIESEDDLELGQ
jgi:hypothetical protein